MSESAAALVRTIAAVAGPDARPREDPLAGSVVGRWPFEHGLSSLCGVSPREVNDLP
jgi:hypothetical protein